jgi:hypothetical protein
MHKANQYISGFTLVQNSFFIKVLLRSWVYKPGSLRTAIIKEDEKNDTVSQYIQSTS